MNNENLFTPYVHEGSLLRAHMELSNADEQAFDNLPSGNTGKSVVVFDHMSNRKFEVKRADCGAGCYCAAAVIREVEDRDDPITNTDKYVFIGTAPNKTEEEVLIMFSAGKTITETYNGLISRGFKIKQVVGKVPTYTVYYYNAGVE